MKDTFIDMTGDRYGQWTVISLHKIESNTTWNCVCKCGRTKIIQGYRLRNKKPIFCECLRKLKATNVSTNERAFVLVEGRKHYPAYDPTRHVGEVHANLTIKSFQEYKRDKHGWVYPLMLCECRCGNYKAIPLRSILKKDNKSCGCLFKGKCSSDHGPIRKHFLYSTWNGIVGRCYVKSNTSYKRYGAIGIKVCEEWRRNFWSFVAWCEENGYAPGLELDRIDNKGGYTPQNCRLVTKQINLENRSNILKISYLGKLMTTRELAAISNGVPYAVIGIRITKKGWDVDRAISTPVTKRIKKNM